ncbi:MAG: VWA domain-containing protein, partial [Myxococcota bacterium]|nr:VWA domain-containing protein [Myxococcota bacterium]
WSLPEWANPLWFAALPLALLLPWLGRSPRMGFSSIRGVQAQPTLRTRLAHLPRILLSLSLGLLVIALARPQEVDRQRVVETDGIDIMLVLDTSGSMEHEDFTLANRRATRLAVAREVLARFVRGRPDDRMGLVVFGEEAFTQVPLTLDHDAMVNFLGQVRIGMAGKRATAIGEALAIAGQRLSRLDAETRVLVLLTDGRNNAGQLAPMQAAEALAALGIRVYTVGVGSSRGGGGLLGLMTGGDRELDEKTLKAIAAITDGAYFRADDTEGLLKVYATIDELETTTAESKEFVHRHELFGTWLSWALVLLLLQWILGETWLRRLP